MTDSHDGGGEEGPEAVLQPWNAVAVEIQPPLASALPSEPAAHRMKEGDCKTSVRLMAN